jgi:hypothetical protein
VEGSVGVEPTLLDAGPLTEVPYPERILGRMQNEDGEEMESGKTSLHHTRGVSARPRTEIRHKIHPAWPLIVPRDLIFRT